MSYCSRPAFFAGLLSGTFKTITPVSFGKIVEANLPAMDLRGLSFDPDIASANASIMQQARSYELRGVHTNGKAETLSTHDGGRIHTHNLAIGSHQRSARVAGIERGIGLDDVVDQTTGVGPQRTT